MQSQHTTSTKNKDLPVHIQHIYGLLQANRHTGFISSHPPADHRFIPLRKTELFDKLVTLYHGLFKTYWSSFKRAMAGYNDIDDKILYAATCYVSGWFWDLHVTLRKGVFNLSSMAFVEHFRDDIHHISDEYDPFLQHLNSIIRPTHIQMGLENTLYVPIIAEKLDLIRLSDDRKSIGNIFNIPNFQVDECVTHSVIYIMQRSDNPFCVVPLSNHDLGRPGWLFDYRQGYAYSWFPMENNYSNVDLIAPHILGIPLSPRLASRDVDEWQIFPGGVLPANLNSKDYKRISPRNLFGSNEYTTLEHELYAVPHPLTAFDCPAPNLNIITRVGSKRAVTEPMEPNYVYRYRLVDWIYYGQVTDGSVSQIARNNALRDFIFNAGRTDGVASAQDRN